MVDEFAFFRPVDDEIVDPTPFARSLWAPGTLNGPAVCALAAMRAEASFGSTGFRPARFTIDLFKVARELPTRTRQRLVRSGGRIRVAEIDVLQRPADAATDADEVLVARGTTVFLAESSNPPGQRWTRPAEQMTFTPPDGESPDSFPRFSSDSSDGRIGPWDSDMGNHQNGGRKRVWSRAGTTVSGHALTPFVRAVTAAESTSLVSNWGSTGIGFINCDLTVALARLPEGDRVGVEADTHTEYDGISVSTSGLYDRSGMFGAGMVTAVNNAAAEIDFTSVDVTGRYREG
ncbi:thioesterase family protein [Gordonia sinesedis]